jgi:hypothetical protein
MKTLLILLLVGTACATTGSRIPSICQKNLQYCLEAYSSTKNSSWSVEDWNAACFKDLEVCKSNWGM